MSINNGKKIGAAVALASMFAGGSMSAVDFKSAMVGSLTLAAVLGIADVGLNKSPWNFIKEKAGAPEGLWKKFRNKNNGGDVKIK